MILIETKTLATATSSISFTNIPADFSDLVILGSLRSSASAETTTTSYKLNTLSPSGTRLEGNGSSASSDSLTTFRVPANNATANTFGSSQIYLTDYRGTANKRVSIDTVTENNATAAFQEITEGTFELTAAVTSFEIISTASNFVAGSTISLYGILKGSSGGVTTS